MDITLIEGGDLQRHAQLFVKVFSLPPWRETWSQAPALERLQCFLDTPHFIGLQLLVNGELKGFLFGNCEPFQNDWLFFIKEMCVCPSVQGQGLGSALLAELKVKLSKKGVTSIYLLTARGSDAEGFYLNNGFELLPKYGLYFQRLA